MDKSSLEGKSDKTCNIGCGGRVGRIKDHNRSGPLSGQLNYSLGTGHKYFLKLPKWFATIALRSM